MILCLPNIQMKESSLLILPSFWLFSFLQSIMSAALTNTSFSPHYTLIPLPSSCLSFCLPSSCLTSRCLPSSCLPSSCLASSRLACSCLSLSFLPPLSSTFPHRLPLSATVKQNSNDNKQQTTEYINSDDIHNNKKNNQSKQSPLKYFNSKNEGTPTFLKDGSNTSSAVPVMVVDNHSSVATEQLHGKSGEAFPGCSPSSSLNPFSNISANSAVALKREMFLRLFARTAASSNNSNTTTASIPPPPVKSSHGWRNDVEEPFENTAGLLSNVPHMVDNCYVDVSDSGQQLTITQIKQRQHDNNNCSDDEKLKQLDEVSDGV
eukprot:GHVS01020223.1.p1 GENE.GHVS01020223.1~~GHVS01020223.1.p1  ORF type:complete len:320 (-),score=69.09 GHVS01020223.1:112-1071(-)